MTSNDPDIADPVEVEPVDAEPVELTQAERDELVEAEPQNLAVDYSGQDFDVAGLVRRLDADDILIPTFGHDDGRIQSAGFQRSFVWNRPQMDRFIESLLLGYPIPGVFFIRQSDRRYLVLDGQQRLRTLQLFHDGIFDGKEFALRNVADDFKGLTYATLQPHQRRLFDNTFIQATIVVSDGTPTTLNAIYQIFERLNAGGTPLTAHEIRVALHAGPFIDFLAHLNGGRDWRQIYGKVSPRLRDQELILRILALDEQADTYRRPLKAFLNDFVGSHRGLGAADLSDVESRFTKASHYLNDAVGRDGFRLKGYQINAAVTEAIFVGFMRQLDRTDQFETRAIEKAVRAIANDPDFVQAVSRATADEDAVRTRLEIATTRFAEV